MHNYKRNDYDLSVIRNCEREQGVCDQELFMIPVCYRGPLALAPGAPLNSMSDICAPSMGPQGMFGIGQYRGS